MNKTADISLLIKKQVLEIVPQAYVLLFGSRATGTTTEESDWDILVLTQQPADKKLKDAIHKKVFPLSVQIGAFINLLIVQQQEWDNNPAYYSLHQTVDTTSIAV